jgi:hypothetical protein
MRESSPSILKLDTSLSHLRNLRANLNITKMQNLYKCTEGVVAKLSQRRQSKQLQTMIFVITITNNVLCRYIYEVYFISFWCIDLKCIINYKLIYNNNNSFNSLMQSLEHPGNNSLFAENGVIVRNLNYRPWQWVYSISGCKSFPGGF